MADETPEPRPPGMPSWVKLFAIVGGIILVLVVVMTLSGHDPGQHMKR